MTTPKPEPMSAERLVDIRHRLQDEEYSHDYPETTGVIARELLAEVDRLSSDQVAANAELVTERAAHAETQRELSHRKEDLFAAAGELGVNMTEATPGSTVAKLLAANSIMRNQRDTARSQHQDARRSVQKHVGDYAKLESRLAVLRGEVDEAERQVAASDRLYRRQATRIRELEKALRERPTFATPEPSAWEMRCRELVSKDEVITSDTPTMADTNQIEVRTAGDSDELVRGGDRFDNGPAAANGGPAQAPAAGPASKPGLVVGQRYELKHLPVGATVSDGRGKPWKINDHMTKLWRGKVQTGNFEELVSCSDINVVLVSLPDTEHVAEGGE